jgi:hypothetical protein
MNANELADYLENDFQIQEAVIDMLRQQQAEIEEWKRKYKDMHNLATQAMSRNHQLEKKEQEK